MSYKEKLDRRDFMKAAGAGVLGVAVGGCMGGGAVSGAVKTDKPNTTAPF